MDKYRVRILVYRTVLYYYSNIKNAVLKAHDYRGQVIPNEGLIEQVDLRNRLNLSTDTIRLVCTKINVVPYTCTK